MESEDILSKNLAPILKGVALCFIYVLGVSFLFSQTKEVQYLSPDHFCIDCVKSFVLPTVLLLLVGVYFCDKVYSHRHLLIAFNATFLLIAQYVEHVQEAMSIFGLVVFANLIVYIYHFCFIREKKNDEVIVPYLPQDSQLY